MIADLDLGDGEDDDSGSGCCAGRERCEPGHRWRRRGRCARRPVVLEVME
jgi:hypothetical protein